MRPPIRVNRQPRRRGYERPVESACEHCGWKDSGQFLGEARQRLPISFCLLVQPLGHIWPGRGGHYSIEPVKPLSLSQNCFGNLSDPLLYTVRKRREGPPGAGIDFTFFGVISVCKSWKGAADRAAQKFNGDASWPIAKRN